MIPSIQTRAEFQPLAEVRIREAKALLDLGMWDGAYYLVGYSVELALKACIIKMLMTTDAFPDREFSRNCYTHSLARLVVLAGLEPARLVDIAADPILNANWLTVERWSEETRYRRIDQAEAEGLYSAIVDATNGVFSWVKTYW